MAFVQKSEYFQSLQKDVAARYMDKIRVIQCVDPFCLSTEEISTALEDFPPITAFEIITYLILTHSFYTKKQMKAYKSLAGYKYYEAGFVHDCGAKKIGEHIVVVGKVKHSQKMNEAPLRVWIICQQDGAVNSAHCTCMAGQSEVCSHIAAVLYAMEYMNKAQCNTSSTDVKAKWVNPAVTHVPIVKLSQINLKPKQSSANVISLEDQIHSIPALEGQELQAFLRKIKDDGDDSVLLRVVEPFATELSQESSNILNLSQNPYKYDIYKEEYELLAYADLCDLARQIDESLSDEQRQNIQSSTVQQNQCNEWYRQRAGRITGSSFKRVCHTSILKPSLSTVKAICYPLDIHFKSKAVAWGLQHEAQALKAYEERQMNNHHNFKIYKVGLCIDKENSFLAASPDSLVSCDCCGSGCVEVKCPYLLKDSDFEEYLTKKNSFLEKKNGEVTLKCNHSYYYQIQLELRVTASDFCDFVVWSPNHLFVERIFHDEGFWVRNFGRAYDFHKRVVLPELLGRYFTKSKHLDQQWCLCQSVNDNRLMIQCENDCCNIQWFHLNCVGLLEVPNELWFCEACSNQGSGSADA